MRATRRIEKKKNRQRIAAVAVIVVIAAAAGGGFLWYQYQAGRDIGTGAGVSTDGEAGAADSGTVEYNGSTYVYNDHLSNYLFMGIDVTQEESQGDINLNAGQADSIFLVSLDRVTEELRVLMIQRDTKAEIESFNPAGKSLGTSTDHINIQYGFGDGKTKSCELMETAVSKLLYDVPVNGYYAMNLDGIGTMTDAVGGVEVTVPDDSLETVNPEFKKGEVVTITGENAEQYVRYRDIDRHLSAQVRQNRQKSYLTALLQKAQEKAGEDVSFVTEFYNSIQNYTVTNMGTDIFAKLLTASGNSDMKTETVPGEYVEGDPYDEYHVDKDGLYEQVLSMFYNKQS